MPPPSRVQVAVVGAGAAGLYAALVAARAGASVALVSRSPLAESASYWAQGGIAAAFEANDSPARHAADTLAAGRGLSRAGAVEVLCEDAPGAVEDLESLGVRFDRAADGALALGLEGGHSRRRVVHAGGSATGRRITRELSALAATDERVGVLERTTAAALWVDEGRCIGLVTDAGEAIIAGGTILATGGAAALWQRTTNPSGAIGSGLSLALEAGARAADLEFVQFHPTALVAPGPSDGFLITEAVRGEGALLLDERGERFVDELAPRDEVALAVAARGGARLDLRPVDLTRFPNIAAKLAEVGVDPRREPVAVAPAAHYTMGGIATDLDGRASLAGLFAVGECGCNGLHGANRLASNSLAECFVFGRRAGIAAAEEPAPRDVPPPAPPAAPRPLPSPATREALTRLAGIERDRIGLERLLADEFPLARAVAACALARRESRGAHQRSDHPRRDPALDGRHSLVDARGEPHFEAWV